MGWLDELWGLRSNPFSIRELISSDELERLFVDRDIEIRLLYNALTSSPGGVVYGISGIRGSGKSTVLNKVLEKVKETRNNLVVKIKASGYYEELDFLQKILTDVCDQVETAELPLKVKEEIVRLKTNLLYSEKIEQAKASERAIKASIKANILSILGGQVGSEDRKRIQKAVERQLKPYTKSTLTREILKFLNFLKKEAGYDLIVIGIDETDKCRFTVAEKLLDSVKTVLGTDDCHFVFVGTLEFHRNFIKAFQSGKEEEATIASIFEGVVPIKSFNENQILEIVEKRIKYYSLHEKTKNPFNKDAIQVILQLSNGIPKQALRLFSESFIYFGEKGTEIGPKELVSHFEDRGYIPELTALQKRYVTVVRKLEIVEPRSETFIEELSKLKVRHRKKEQYHVQLDRLVDKRYLVKEVDKVKGVIYKPTELCRYVSL